MMLTSAFHATRIRLYTIKRLISEHCELLEEVIRLGKYPYILNTGKLKEFIENIPRIGVPPKINTATLPTLGFKSPNDRPIISILKFVDFIDSSGSPSQNYRDFRVQSKARTVMASAVKKAYSEVFELYPNAYEKDDKTLKDFFAPTTEAGEQVVDLTVATFKALCSFADFKATPEEKAEEEEEVAKLGKKGEKVPSIPSGVTINLNIQLTLPVTDNEKVYENIFKALRDNLLARESKAD